MNPVQMLRKAAMALPEAEEGTSCKKIAFRARKKNYLFIGQNDDGWNVMLKVTDSVDEAKKLASKHPDTYSVNPKGWVSATFDPKQSPPAGVFERWIVESFVSLAPKALVATMDANPVAKKKVAKKKRPRN